VERVERMGEARGAGDGPPPEIIQAALEMWRHTGQLHQVPVSGQSMLPLLHPGDRVLVAHGARLASGDLLVYQRAGGWIAHRLIGWVEPAGIVAAESAVIPECRACRVQGDNLLEPDPLVQPEEVAGRVIAIQRDGRILRLDTTAWRLAGRLFVFEVQFCVFLCRALPGQLFWRRACRRARRWQMRAWLAIAGRWQA
jgi:hypothetical protein